MYIDEKTLYKREKVCYNKKCGAARRELAPLFLFILGRLTYGDLCGKMKGKNQKEKNTMKKPTKVLLRLIISIIYIIWGIAAPLSLHKSVLALNLSAILSAALGVLTLLAGIFGLLGIKKKHARIFGIVLFALAVLSIVSAVASLSFGALVQPAINAVLAWLFIICV